jgi:sec-independent protein translocase protein TatC
MADTPDSSEREFAASGLVKPFLEHLEDLRWTLIKCVIVVAVMMGLCLGFVKELIGVLYLPLTWSGVTDDPNSFLTSLGVVDPFTVAFKVGIYGGLVLSIPFVLYFVGQFVLPALTNRERGYLWPAFTAGAIMFLLGLAFCYFLLIPQTLGITWRFGQYLGWHMQWTIQSYMAFVIQFSMAMGLGFEAPVVILVLVRMGILSSATLRKFRRHVVVINVIAAAFITPGTDVMSLCLVAIPMCVLYEACVWIAWWMDRTPAQKTA